MTLLLLLTGYHMYTLGPGMWQDYGTMSKDDIKRFEDDVILMMAGWFYG